MIGGFQFRLNSNKLQYDFVVNRKITKIIGDSATGKSELVATVATKDDAAMNIHITCKYEAVEIGRAFSEILGQSFFLWVCPKWFRLSPSCRHP